MKALKNQLIGFLLGIGLTFSLGVFAASNGTLGELFNLISSGLENGTTVSNVYRLSGENIQDGTLTSYEIENETINSVDIKDGTITSSDLASNSVGTSEIIDGSISSTDIQDGSVTSIDIQNNTITESDISDSFIARNADKLDNINSSQFLRSDVNDTMNGVLTISNSSYGIKSYGKTYGGYFKDSDASGYAILGNGDYGVIGRGNTYGGYFQDLTSGKYGILGYGSYTLYGNGDIRVDGKITSTGNMYTGGNKVATEDYVINYVDNNSSSSISITCSCGTCWNTKTTNYYDTALAFNCRYLEMCTPAGWKRIDYKCIQ